jgi:hypothetical protein
MKRMGMKSNLPKHYVLYLFFLSFGFIQMSVAQQNMGIGTASPHPSSILHLADTTGKGALIPRTDTNAVNAYVNSLTPNPGIANGLLIYQKSANAFYYYDGDQNRWIPLSGVVGPKGVLGPAGPTGLRGPQGGFSVLRDTSTAPGGLKPTDKIGDYFFNSVTGEMFEVNQLGTGWTKVISTAPGPRAIWRSKVQDGIAIHKSSTSLQTDIMPSAASTISYQTINGLNHIVNVGFDSTAFVFIRAYGTVRKVNPNNDYNYAQFDLRVSNTPAEVQQIVGIGPNGPAPDNHFDQVSWSIGFATQLAFGSNLIEVRGGQRFSQAGNGDIILADGPGSENQAHMDIYVIYRKLD